MLRRYPSYTFGNTDGLTVNSIGKQAAVTDAAASVRSEVCNPDFQCDLEYPRNFGASITLFAKNGTESRD